MIYENETSEWYSDGLGWIDVAKALESRELREARKDGGGGRGTFAGPCRAFLSRLFLLEAAIGLLP